MKNKTAFILMLLPLTLGLSGCQSTSDAKQVIEDAIAAGLERAGQTDENIMARMEEWWALKQAGDPSVVGVSVADAAKEAARLEWAQTRKDLEAITKQGERDAKEAMSGWGNEVMGNVGNAVGVLTSGGGMLAALLTLLGVSGGSVAIARGYTKIKVLEQENARDKKYGAGGPFANLALLSQNADRLLAVAAHAPAQPVPMPAPVPVQQMPPPQGYQPPSGYTLVPNAVAAGVYPSTGRKLPDEAPAA